MDAKKRKRLEAAGWKVGTVSEFLSLTHEEEEYVELKLALTDYFRALRKKRGITQGELAKRMQSSQSRVAAIERGYPDVSVELILRALIALGANHRQIGRTLAAA